MNDITKIKVDGETESTYKLFSKNREFEKRAGGNGGSQKGLIVNIVGEESNLGNTYLLFDKTDEEIYNAVYNGITVTLKVRGYNLQCIKDPDIMFWGVVPYTLGSNGITKLEVWYVSAAGMGWFAKRTYIEATALAQ